MIIQIASLTTLPTQPIADAGFWISGQLVQTNLPGAIYDVNDLGWAVGVEFVNGNAGDDVSYLWRNGTVTLLTQFETAFALNDSGQVAGSVIYTGSGATGLAEAAIYQGGQTTLLGLLAPSITSAYSAAQAINNEGEVVGESLVASGVSHAFLWKNGVMTDLGVLTQGDSSYAYGINDSGQVVGAEQPAGGNYFTAVLWQNGSMTALPQAGSDDYSFAYAINDAGVIVGAGRARSATQSPTEAIVWDQGQAIVLNNLLGAHSGWDLTTATSITDSGVISGSATFYGALTTYNLTLGLGVPQIGVAAQTAAAAASNIIVAAATAPQIQIIDTAADVQASLDGLLPLATTGELINVMFTDSTLPTLDVTTAQMSADAAVMAKFAGPFLVASPGGDLAGFSGTASQYIVTVLDNGVTITGNGGTITLGGVAELRFADQTELVAQTPASGSVNSGNLAELYGAVFGRQPDIGGLAFYQGYLQSNPTTPLVQFAEWFLSSTEYTAAHSYAQTTAGDTQFIQDSYQNLLHRTASNSEATFYLTNVIQPALANLTPGTQAYAAAELQAHAQTLVYLSASAEFLSDVQITAQTPASTQHWLILT